MNDEKRTKIKELSKDLLSCNKAAIKKLPELIDNLFASFPAVTFGSLQYKPLEKVKINGIKYHNNNFDKKIDISYEGKTKIIN